MYMHTHMYTHTPKSKPSKLNAQGLSLRLCGLRFPSLLWESHSLTSGLHSGKRVLTHRAAHVPSVPQEALRKIITTLAMKNEETQTFIYSLKQMLLNIEVGHLILSADVSADVGAGERPGGTPLSASVSLST